MAFSGDVIPEEHTSNMKVLVSSGKTGLRSPEIVFVNCFSSPTFTMTYGSLRLQLPELSRSGRLEQETMVIANWPPSFCSSHLNVSSGVVVILLSK